MRPNHSNLDDQAVVCVGSERGMSCKDVHQVHIAIGQESSSAKKRPNTRAVDEQNERGDLAAPEPKRAKIATGDNHNSGHQPLVDADGSATPPSSKEPDCFRRYRDYIAAPSSSSDATRREPSDGHLVTLKGNVDRPQTVHIHLHIMADAKATRTHPVRIELDGAVAGNVTLESIDNNKVTMTTSAPGFLATARTTIGNMLSIGSNGVVFQHGNRANAGTVTINGLVVHPPHDQTQQQSLQLNIHGSVGGSVNTSNGNVECTSIAGGVNTTSGDVTCKEGIRGNVSTMSGDVTCSGSVTGNASTMSGDVKVLGNMGGRASTVSGVIKVKKTK